MVAEAQILAILPCLSSNSWENDRPCRIIGLMAYINI